MTSLSNANPVTAAPINDDSARAAAAEHALSMLDLDDKARLLQGQDMWSLPELPSIGLRSLVMSDGPIGVRGVRWTPDDPSVALPSPTALAATWDPAVARAAGNLLAQEAHRKGVHVLLAPTVNLQRSPLGGRHFEAYSEDPFLTGQIGAGYVAGVQEGGIGTTVKHFVANEAETERLTVDNIVDPRTLREVYLAPFEAIVKQARPWGIMAAYNSVNGTTMTEHGHLQNEILRSEWGFDGFIVSDWLAARDTVGAINGGLDVAMPGPDSIFGPALAAAVRSGQVAESVVDDAVRRVLLLAARVGLLEGAPPAVAPEDRPDTIDGSALARDLARRSFVLLRNVNRDDNPALPLDVDELRRIALIGQAADAARIMGGGSAQVSPDHIVSPLAGLRAALPQHVQLDYTIGATPSDELIVADRGFDLVATCRDAEGRVLGETPVPHGRVEWTDIDLPGAATFATLSTVEMTGTMVPEKSGSHRFGTRGHGTFVLHVDDDLLFDATESPQPDSDVFEAEFGPPVERAKRQLEAGRSVPVRLLYRLPEIHDGGFEIVSFGLMHGEPLLNSDDLIAESVASARTSDAAIVVVATTERVESEGSDRTSLRLPGRQDQLVEAIAAVNDRTIVVVNAGSPVEMPWRNDVAAVLQIWFPGEEAGSALADVLLGTAEPGGRLPTTWPAQLDDVPVSTVTPAAGKLKYDEGALIGYRAWDRVATPPAFPFGHGLGYTTWTYEHASFEPGTGSGLGSVRVSLRNSGRRAGREVVQIYVRASSDHLINTRPTRQLAGFAIVEAPAGATAEARIEIPRRAVETWNDATHTWETIPDHYTVEVAHSSADCRLTLPLTVAGSIAAPALEASR